MKGILSKEVRSTREWGGGGGVPGDVFSLWLILDRLTLLLPSPVAFKSTF